VTQDDPRLESVYSHYENNLRDIIDILHDKGTHVILSSVPVNLRHSAPFSSVHNSDLSKQQLGKWEEINDKGSQSFEQKNWNGAITSFQGALEIDADYADTHFRLATAYENLKQFEKAKTHYERSLDLDTLRFRADTNINQVIQNVAASIEYDAFDFVDSLAAFEQVSKPFQPGWNLLYEHVHYDFLGNHILATELSRSILSNVTASDNYQPLSSVEVAKRIGYPNKESVDVMKPLLKMVQSPPFTGQSNASELKAFIAEKKARVTKEVGSPTEVIQRRKEIIDSGAADWKIHFEMAGLYWKLHNRRAVYHHLNEVFRLYPHNRKSRMRMIDIMSKDGKFSEVIPHIEQSFYYSRGDEKKIAQSIGLLGMAYFKIGEYEKATETLLEMPEKYSDQIGLTLKAYGTLVKYSREEGKAKDLNRYIRDVRQYARTLMREGKDQEYPLLYKRMSQIMLLAGHEKEAKKWKTTQPSSK
jgi:tetratricopeptide (TPR) repeat protein